MGKSKQYRFLVVSENDKYRGAFARDWLTERCKESGIESLVLSAGMNVRGQDVQTRRYAVTDDLVRDADCIVVMDDLLAERLRRSYESLHGKRVVCLHSPQCFRLATHDPVVVNTYSPAQAVAHVQKEYALSPDGSIGPVLFQKILEFHLADVLREVKSKYTSQPTCPIAL